VTDPRGEGEGRCISTPAYSNFWPVKNTAQSLTMISKFIQSEAIFDLKCTKNPHGELTALPRPLAGIRAPLRSREGQEMEAREGTKRRRKEGSSPTANFWDRHCQDVLASSVRSYYTVSQKKQDTKLLPITLPNIGRFSKFFHC